MIESVLKRFADGQTLEKQDLCALLSVPVGGEAYYRLLCAANQYSRSAFQGRGLLFGQIGLDLQPCRINCKFCSLAADVLKGCTPVIRSVEDTVRQAAELAAAGVQDVFLMTTAEFDQQTFLEYGRAVRAALPEEVRLVANVGEFDLTYARQLRQAGFTDELCLMAGANQLYAECGTNPRDTKTETSKGRGFSVQDARAMLEKAEWK